MSHSVTTKTFSDSLNVGTSLRNLVRRERVNTLIIWSMAARRRSEGLIQWRDYAMV